ncbi:kinase-like domain-containing protein [Lentinula raphanica]|nr:kinase-like domain-containing protein [Lentinula raphanica]
MTWLVEPKRSSICHKFTGTLSHSRTTFGGLTCETVHAFSHFVYTSTTNQLVVADLQGKPVSTEGRNVLILFDPMTHTIEGTSGCGDFGQEGIDCFVREHVCGPVCEAMGLNNGGGTDSEKEDEPANKDRDDSQATRPKRKRFNPVHDQH